MEKKWLIRTGRKKILGPVTREKIIEFIESDALTPNDEICAPNGYWFYIKEKDLVEKYLYNNEPQGFNPVSDQKSVADIDDLKEYIKSGGNMTDGSKSSDLVLPDQNDLEYPE